MENKISTERFNFLTNLSLRDKIFYTECAINEWYEYWEGKVYVSFSGGKDSTVLLHIVRKIFPDCPAVFSDTGLEYPEIRSFVKTFDNVIWVRPKKRFEQVIQEYGWPVVSKQVSMGIDRYNNTKSERQKFLRMYGGLRSSGKQQQASISKKWHFLLDAPFRCSERCCYFLKKFPIYSYNKSTGRKPFVGTRAADSNIRKVRYLKTGCNSFDQTNAMSTPISIWSDENIEQYIRVKDLNLSEIYKSEDHTGCMFCMFGVHKEEEPNRFQRMKLSHPKHWDFCINKLGMNEVLDFIGVPY